MSEFIARGIATVAAVDFGVQYVFWSVSAKLQTEKFYDFIGSLTHLSVAGLSLFINSQQQNGIARMQCSCISLWALRLGSFLVYRIHRDGSDRRFDKIKKSNAQFFAAWNVQGLWVLLCQFPTLYMMEYASLWNKMPGAWQYIGWSLFAAGFALEAVADHQKLMFKENPKNADKFIDTGLWTYSRHPNYVGEVALWWGLYISAVSSCPNPRRAAAVTVIGPLFVTYLLGSFSVKMLENSADRKYGNNPAYQDYKKRVKKFIPFVW